MLHILMKNHKTQQDIVIFTKTNIDSDLLLG